MNAQVRLLVTGLVQGVFFRANAQRMAKKFSVKGWVKNLLNGDLEIVAEGNKEDLHQFISWCHQGPPGAIVKNVEATWREYEGKFTDFKIIY